MAYFEKDEYDKVRGMSVWSRQLLKQLRKGAELIETERKHIERVVETPTSWNKWLAHQTKQGQSLLHFSAHRGSTPELRLHLAGHGEPLRDAERFQGEDIRMESAPFVASRTIGTAMIVASRDK